MSLCGFRGRTQQERERERERERSRSMVQTGAGKECTHQSKLAEKAIYSLGLVAVELLNFAEVAKLYLSRMT